MNRAPSSFLQESPVNEKKGKAYVFLGLVQKVAFRVSFSICVFEGPKGKTAGVFSMK